MTSTPAPTQSRVPTTAAEDRPGGLSPQRRRRLTVAGWGVLAVALTALPLAVSNRLYLHIGVIVLIHVPLVIGQNLITGNSGQVSMGHAAFYGIGAYVTALAAAEAGLPALLVLPLAAAAAGLVGLVTGLPAIRVSGDYLFIVTIGLNLIFLDVVVQWIPVTGGSAGIPGVPLPTIGPLELRGETAFYYLALVIAVLATAVALLLLHSRFGKTLEALRDDALAAAAVGVDATPIRVSVFVVAAAMAGLSGAVLAYYIGFVGPQSFGIAQSLLIFEMAIIGGLGSVPGSILGALLFVGLPEALRPLQDYRLGLGGVAVVVLMAVRPQGLLGRVKATTLIRK